MLVAQRLGRATRSIVRRIPVPLLIAVLLSMTTMVGTVQANCHETVNPAGNPEVGNNGFPDDLFGGDAVPGGKSTTPGTTVNGPINPDGFYIVGGYIFSDNTQLRHPVTGLTWPNNTTIKYTQWGNKDIKIEAGIGGPNSAIEYHIWAPGDLYAGWAKDDPNHTPIFCGVPPPPF